MESSRNQFIEGTLCKNKTFNPNHLPVTDVRGMKNCVIVLQKSIPSFSSLRNHCVSSQ